MRAETAVSTVATSRPQTASAPPELPFWLPGIGAWPGHVITRIEGGQPVAVWRYEMSSLGGRKVAGQRALTGLSRVTAEDAAHILEALQSERAALPTRTTWQQRGRALLQKVQTGAPLEVAEAIAELRAAGRSRVLSFSEKRLLDTAKTLVRSVLDALPDTPARRRALEILDDRDRKSPACPR